MRKAITDMPDIDEEARKQRRGDAQRVRHYSPDTFRYYEIPAPSFFARTSIDVVARSS